MHKCYVDYVKTLYFWSFFFFQISLLLSAVIDWKKMWFSRPVYTLQCFLKWNVKQMNTYRLWIIIIIVPSNLQITLRCKVNFRGIIFTYILPLTYYFTQQFAISGLIWKSKGKGVSAKFSGGNWPQVLIAGLDLQQVSAVLKQCDKKTYCFILAEVFIFENPHVFFR